MKKAFILLAILGVLFFGCNNGSTGDTPPNGAGLNAKAFSPECVAYIIKDNSTSKSVMASISRSLVIDNVYEFTIVKPKSQTSIGAANGFDTEVINVTVLNKTTLGNGKERFEVRRSDNNTIFKITFDANGMYSIEGLSGAKEGFLNPIGENSNSLYGAYAGCIPDPIGFLITENQIITSNGIIGKPGDYMGTGTGETKMTITSITSNTIDFAETQEGRYQTDGDGNTGDQWVLQKVGKSEHDESNAAYLLKSVEYTLVGDILKVKFTGTWEVGYGVTTPVGQEYEFRRVPTN